MHGIKTFGTIGEIYTWLLGFVNVEKGERTDFRLDRMRSLAHELGEPQLAYKTVHVAGSKGKGTVSAMTAGILAAAGLRTGLYTSPHLISWSERIALAGDVMPGSCILKAADTVAALVDGRAPADFDGGMLPTYFELTTLIAFEAFRLAGCDVAVIETGLGGRLDSTNIVLPEVSVITTIELEHTEILGSTLELIAAEKAGIIKPGRPVCAGRVHIDARKEIAHKAESYASPLYIFDEVYIESEIGLAMEGTSAHLKYRPGLETKPGIPILPGMSDGSIDVTSPMHGRINVQNMGLAILAASFVVEGLSAEAVRSGLAQTRLPARFEIIGEAKRVILDGAHTPDSIRLTVGTLQSLFPEGAVLLFGCAKDKHHADMAQILSRCFDSAIVTRPGIFKESDPEAVGKSFQACGMLTRLIPDTEEACRAAMEEADRRRLPILVTGSFYLCAIARQIMA